MCCIDLDFIFYLAVVSMIGMFVTVLVSGFVDGVDNIALAMNESNKDNAKSFVENETSFEDKYLINCRSMSYLGKGYTVCEQEIPIE